jgi:hypothetical protein
MAVFGPPHTFTHTVPGRAHTMGILDDVKAQVSKLDENQLRERLAKLQLEKEARKAKQTERNKSLTEEEKAKRNERATAYRMKNLDKFKASRAAYNKKPEVVERRKAYMSKRNAEKKAILARAKELGITA